MQDEVFNKGIARLQGAFDKDYAPDMLAILWDKVGSWTDDSWNSIVDHLIETQDRLPRIKLFFTGRTEMREKGKFGYDGKAMESCGGCHEGIRYIEQADRDDFVGYGVVRCDCPAGEKYRGLPNLAAVRKSWHFRRVLAREETPVLNQSVQRKVPLMGEAAERFTRIAKQINSFGANAGLHVYLMADMGMGNSPEAVGVEEEIPF